MLCIYNQLLDVNFMYFVVKSYPIRFMDIKSIHTAPVCFIYCVPYLYISSEYVHHILYLAVYEKATFKVDPLLSSVICSA